MAAMPTRIGEYDIERVLASGTMGDVFKGRKMDPQRKVPVYYAVKTLNPKAARRLEWCGKFHSELKTIIKDEHLLEYKDISQDSAYDYFFVADYLECKPASRQSLRRERSHEILDCFIKIANALDKAHKKGYVHGNIKPSNVIVRRGEGGRAQAILSDMGLTYIYDAAQFTGEKFQAVVPYMSPERIQELTANVEAKNSKLKPTADTYSLAAVLVEALSGSKPFGGCANLEELDKAKQSKKYLLLHVNFPVRHVAIQKLNDVVKKALSYEAGSRYGSAAELASALEACKVAEEKKPQ